MMSRHFQIFCFKILYMMLSLLPHRRQASNSSNPSNVGGGGTLHSQIQNVNRICVSSFDSVLQQLASSSISSGAQKAIAEVVQPLRHDVLRAVQSLSSVVPDVDEKEIAHLMQKVDNDITKLSMSALRQGIISLQVALREHAHAQRQSVQEIEILQGKLRRKNEVVSYIRNTLWKEVTMLREQLYQQEHQQQFDANVFSIFDFMELVEDETDEGKKAALGSVNKLRDEIEAGQTAMKAAHREEVLKLEGTVRQLTSELEYMKSQRGKKVYLPGERVEVGMYAKPKMAPRWTMVRCGPSGGLTSMMPDGTYDEEDEETQLPDAGPTPDAQAVQHMSEEIEQLRKVLVVKDEALDECNTAIDTLKDVQKQNEKHIVKLTTQRDNLTDRAALLDKQLQDEKAQVVELKNELILERQGGGPSSPSSTGERRGSSTGRRASSSASPSAAPSSRGNAPTASIRRGSKYNTSSSSSGGRRASFIPLSTHHRAVQTDAVTDSGLAEPLAAPPPPPAPVSRAPEIDYAGMIDEWRVRYVRAQEDCDRVREELGQVKHKLASALEVQVELREEVRELRRVQEETNFVDEEDYVDEAETNEINPAEVDDDEVRAVTREGSTASKGLVNNRPQVLITLEQDMLSQQQDGPDMSSSALVVPVGASEADVITPNAGNAVFSRQEFESMQRALESEIHLRDVAEKELEIVQRQLKWKATEVSRLTTKLLALSHVDDSIAGEEALVHAALDTPLVTDAGAPYTLSKCIVLVDWSAWRATLTTLAMEHVLSLMTSMRREVIRDVRSFHGRLHGENPTGCTYVLVCFDDPVLALQWGLYLLRKLRSLPDIVQKGKRRKVSFRVSVDRGDTVLETNHDGIVCFYGPVVASCFSLAQISRDGIVIVSDGVGEDVDFDSSVIRRLLDNPGHRRRAVLRPGTPSPQTGGGGNVDECNNSPREIFVHEVCTTEYAPKLRALSQKKDPPAMLRPLPTPLSLTARLQLDYYTAVSGLPPLETVPLDGHGLYAVMHHGPRGSVVSDPFEASMNPAMMARKQTDPAPPAPPHPQQQQQQQQQQPAPIVMERRFSFDPDDARRQIRRAHELEAELLQLRGDMTLERERHRAKEELLAASLEDANARCDNMEGEMSKIIVEARTYAKDAAADVPRENRGMPRADRLQFIHQITSLSHRLERAMRRPINDSIDIQTELDYGPAPPPQLTTSSVSWSVENTSSSSAFAVAVATDTRDIAVRCSSTGVGTYAAYPRLAEKEVQCELLLPCPRCVGNRNLLHPNAIDVSNQSLEEGKRAVGRGPPRPGSGDVLKGLQLALSNPTARPDTTALVPLGAPLTRMPQSNTSTRPVSGKPQHLSQLHRKIIESAQLELGAHASMKEGEEGVVVQTGGVADGEDNSKASVVIPWGVGGGGKSQLGAVMVPFPQVRAATASPCLTLTEKGEQSPAESPTKAQGVTPTCSPIRLESRPSGKGLRARLRRAKSAVPSSADPCEHHNMIYRAEDDADDGDDDDGEEEESLHDPMPSDRSSLVLDARVVDRLSGKAPLRGVKERVRRCIDVEKFMTTMMSGGGGGGGGDKSRPSTGNGRSQSALGTRRPAGAASPFFVMEGAGATLNTTAPLGGGSGQAVPASGGTLLLRRGSAKAKK